ncbi:MAG: FAD-dependent oxidoreductase, partial [Eubacterium sp.]|nr:FAD-dependent oxidoreductase [Eubacterium sp.]
GYEEAAAQGLVAGINAARKIKGESEFILDRGSSYIGTLIDDLVTKGCTDPYRMMTSRSEYRLVLRQDNADLRLTPLGHEIGLISDKRYDAFLEKKRLIEEEFERVKNLSVPMSDELQQILEKKGTAPMKTGCKMLELLKRPQIGYEDLKCVDTERPDLPDEVFEQVEISIKYEGYIKKQEAALKEMRRIEAKQIPCDIDYSSLKGLRLEAVEKLSKIRPQNLGQASRISGVNPADITALNIILESL